MQCIPTPHSKSQHLQETCICDVHSAHSQFSIATQINAPRPTTHPLISFYLTGAWYHTHIPRPLFLETNSLASTVKVPGNGQNAFDYLIL
jgi:hypothetical protein